MSGPPWFLTRRAGHDRVRLRMFCFSYAGGSAAPYLRWQDHVDQAIEVVGIQLPGRGSRLKETPLTSLADLVAQLGARIDFPDRAPFVFFGHSLGGLVAFELARYCRLRGMSQPSMLFASGCDAPQFRSKPRNLHELHGDQFIGALAKYNGTPPELLAHRELMDLLAPTIRADFSIAAGYQYRPGLLLTMPITVLSGRLDTELDLEHIAEWKRETSGECRVEWFDGDHFFINAQSDLVLDFLNRQLKLLIPD